MARPFEIRTICPVFKCQSKWTIQILNCTVNNQIPDRLDFEWSFFVHFLCWFLNGFGGHFVKNHSKTGQNQTQTVKTRLFCPVFEWSDNLKTGPDIFLSSLDRFGLNKIFVITMKWSRLGLTIRNPDYLSGF